jgi:2-dehydropantoate 2-reductase
MTMARIAIVGVGAIGGVLAGLLETAARHDLTLCTRRPLPVLQVDTPEGQVHVRATNLLTPERATSVDWVLVATKTYDAAGARLWLKHLCGPTTRIAVIQNGVEHREHFAPEFDVLPVIIDVPCERRPDGSILQRSSALLRVESSAEGAAFARLFANTLANVDITTDFVSAAWHKLCINAAGVVSALTLKPAGVLADPALGQLAVDLIAECVAVARAEGATLPDDTGARILANYRAGSPDSINSLLADRIAGRPIEIDARNGVIVQRGERHGIPTPLNRMAVALMKGMA